MTDQEKEKQIQDKENANIVAFFLSLYNTTSLYDSVMHVFKNNIKTSVYDEEFLQGLTKKEVAQSRRKAKQIVSDMNNFRKLSQEVLKVATLNPHMNKIFEGNAYKLFEDIQKKTQRSILKHVESVGEEVYMENKKES